MKTIMKIIYGILKLIFIGGMLLVVLWDKAFEKSCD